MNNICSFDNVVFENDAMVMLDTSFVMCFLGCDDYQYGSNKTNQIYRRKECEKLIKKLADASGIFTISVKTEEELRGVVTRQAFKSKGLELENQIKEFKQNHYEQYNHIIGQANNDISDYLKKLKCAPNFFEKSIGKIDSSTMDLAAELQNKYSIHGFSDAIQVAIALQEEVTHLASLDKDFNNVNEENLQILVDKNTYENIK